MTNLEWLSATELRGAYERRDTTPSEVLAALVKQIEAVDPVLNAFTTLALEPAMHEARAADAAYGKPGRTRALEGLPLAVKDLFDTAGIRTTYGSRIYADHMPKFDARAVARARAAGAIVIGKAATHEFGWGITTNNPHFGPTRNPWDPERIPGGSSGGAAVALATGMAPLAIGSDTGGSIRIPAAFCGVVGCKPTWGRVSAAGAIPLARSLDHAGAMARTPADAALLYAVIAGVDPNDPATEAVPVTEPAWEGVAGITVGVPEAAGSAPLGPPAAAAVEQSADLLESLGARVASIVLPDPEDVLATFATIQRAEALHSHRGSGRYPARAAEYGPDVRGRLEVAAQVTLADYLDAMAERQRIRAEVARALRKVDVLLSAVSAIPPPPIGSETVEHLGAERDVRQLVMTYTVLQDLVGLPACALPTGFDELGLPVAVQITAGPWQEALVLRVAEALNIALPDELHQRRPEIALA